MKTGLVIKPVILAGGSGSRLWPLSRLDTPKQFVKLHGRKSLFQNTVVRASALAVMSKPIVVTSSDYIWLVRAQLSELEADFEVIAEPSAKNTAPAVALAAMCSEDADCMLILPSDHYFDDEEKSIEVLRLGCGYAKAAKQFITFGVQPTHPHSGYGYICTKADESNSSTKTVSAFLEKPDTETATTLIEDKGVLWNSGIFAFRVDWFLHELKRLEPTVAKFCELSLKNREQLEVPVIHPNKSYFQQCPEISIDKGIMEKTSNICVLAMATGWSDLGSWESLWERASKDADHNSSSVNVLTSSAKNSLILGRDEKLTVVVGLENLVVVDSADALLISSKDSEASAREAVELVKSTRPDFLKHKLEVQRPWGNYRVLASGSGYQTKILKINSAAQISLQKHRYREEKWIVLSGEAHVRLDDKELFLGVGEGVQIPAGAIHMVRNEGNEPLEILEAQFGSYLGEDDIERISDIYGRI